MFDRLFFFFFRLKKGLYFVIITCWPWQRLWLIQTFFFPLIKIRKCSLNCLNHVNSCSSGRNDSNQRWGTQSFGPLSKSYIFPTVYYNNFVWAVSFRAVFGDLISKSKWHRTVKLERERYGSCCLQTVCGFTRADRIERRINVDDLGLHLWQRTVVTDSAVPIDSDRHNIGSLSEITEDTSLQSCVNDGPHEAVHFHVHFRPPWPAFKVSTIPKWKLHFLGEVWYNLFQTLYSCYLYLLDQRHGAFRLLRFIGRC